MNFPRQPSTTQNGSVVMLTFPPIYPSASAVEKSFWKKINKKLSNQKTERGQKKKMMNNTSHARVASISSSSFHMCKQSTSQSLNDSDDSKGKKVYIGEYMADRSRCCQLLKMTKHHSPQALLIAAQMDNESSPVNPLWSYPGAQLFGRKKKKVKNIIDIS